MCDFAGSVAAAVGLEALTSVQVFTETKPPIFFVTGKLKMRFQSFFKAEQGLIRLRNMLFASTCFKKA